MSLAQSGAHFCYTPIAMYWLIFTFESEQKMGPECLLDIRLNFWIQYQYLNNSENPKALSVMVKCPQTFGKI